MSTHRLAVVLAPLAAVALLGCAAPGKWSLKDVDPSTARADVDVHELTLQQDKAYYATGPQGRTDEGVWKWDGPVTDGLLVLEPRIGAARSYKAKLESNEKLVLETAVRGEPVKASYSREE